MGKQTGFLEYDRVDGPVVCEAERIKNFDEFHGLQNINKQQIQAARCMNCGTPFCQAGTIIAGMAVGCPLNNLVPELNDLVYQGCFEQAYRRPRVLWGKSFNDYLKKSVNMDSMSFSELLGQLFKRFIKK